MNLLERETEISRIGEMIDGAVQGTGDLLLVEGPAGIGKTSLLEASHEIGAGRGMRVLTARATELEREFPFAVVSQLLEPPIHAASAGLKAELLGGSARHAAPVLGLTDAEPAGPAAEFATLHGLYWLIANLADRDPLLLVVDDAHWADPDSLRFLAFLSPRLTDLPVLMLLTARPEEWDHPAPLASTASDPATRPISLAPLSEAATATVVASRFDGRVPRRFAAACHEASGGIPFYLHALIDELHSDRVRPDEESAAMVAALTPPAVARAIIAQLARLGDDAGALARALAVLGDRATVADAARLAGLDPAAGATTADVLTSWRILTTEDERLSFAHPIIRNVVYDDISAGEQQELHRRAAKLLADARSAPEHIAPHLLAITPTGDADVVATLRAAARATLDRGGVGAAISYLRRALNEPPEAGGPLGDTLRELGLAEVRGRDERCIGHLREALTRVEADPARRAETAAELALAYVHFAREPEAVELLRLELARIDDAPLEVRMSLEAEFAATMLFGLDQPLTELDRRLGQLRTNASAESPAGRRVLATLAFRLAQRGGDAAHTAEIARNALQRGLLDDVGSNSIFWLSACAGLMYGGTLDEVLQWATKGLRRAEEIADPLGTAMNLNWISWAALASGDLRNAEATATDSLRLVRDHRITIGQPAVAEAMIDALTARGETEAAWSELERDGFAVGCPQLSTAGWLMEARGRLRASSGDHRGALEDFSCGSDLFRRWGATAPGVTSWRTDAVDSLLALGRRDDALQLAQEDLALARRSGARRSIARATRALALTARGDEQIGGLERSAQMLADYGARLEQARTLIDLGAALRRAGRRSAAREPLNEGLDIALSCGAWPLVERAYTELEATGARPRKIVRTGTDALTPSERRVADMAASGSTNREIAQQLFVTKKTVEFHLGQVYRKLDIASRSQLAAALNDADQN